MTDPSARVAIAAEGLSAEIDPLGAQLHALRDPEGRDLLWDGDAAIWAGRAPILFPIIGELNQGAYRLDDQTYWLPRHGLARRRGFEVVEQTASSARLRLEADDETRAIYPFEFRLDIDFELSGATLTLAATIGNQGSSPMPASFGFHPAFRWPLPYGGARDAHGIVFDHDEPAPIRRLSAAGLLTPKPHPTPVVGRDLHLRDDLFNDDVVIFDRLSSGALTYGAPAGPRLRIDLKGARYLGLWTKPGAPFVCIEPWQGIADPEGYQGDFRAKPGIFEVEPGGSRQVAISVTLEPS